MIHNFRYRLDILDCTYMNTKKCCTQTCSDKSSALMLNIKNQNHFLDSRSSQARWQKAVDMRDNGTPW